MRRKLVLLGVAALAPFKALAADLPSTAPPPAPVFTPVPAANWAGFYAGSFVGGLFAVDRTRQAGSASGTGDGYSTGVLTGYNFQSGAIVYGLEGDISANSALHKFPASPGLVANDVQDILSLHGRARLGYDMGAFLPFVAGGLAYGRTAQFQAAPLVFDGETQSRVGWTLGAGLDAKVTLPILGPSVVRGEYLYESYPTTVFGLNGPQLRTDIGAHTFRVALISNLNQTAPKPTNPAVVDWSGDYVGALGGGSWDSLSTSAGGASTKLSAAGPIGGLYSGHNWTFGDTMLGFEGATMLAHIAGNGPQPMAAGTTNYVDYSESDLRARAGYAMGRFLPFFATGVAYGQSRQIDPANGNDQGVVPAWSWTAGVGVDYRLTEQLALRTEYVYSHSLTGEDTRLDSDTCCTQRRTSDSLRLGLAYFFR